MKVSKRLRRPLLALGGATAALFVAAPAAMAHHCFIPMYSLNAPASANWLVFSAEDGAALEAGYTAGCDEAVAAGYAALQKAGLPVGIKIFEHMTIGDPKETGRMNPNGANGKGLEYFGAGSELPGMMVMTWIKGADTVEC
ncbi:hypothetical protein [Knoellia subterranea]|uniref:Uncharacterized protein n=1 Tax=Knoellia subterranea KCTC 19937 TaxID=1385521 RepID=A0A0A0JLH0_9MICO|nr:hypothetical protein [Knoellia subterranea]KGN37589.1 hypothetical protein N803_14030 [Knoellia subterranea KCTC 19937]